MAQRKQRRALLVVGMHRSGTSCVARVVNLLGRDTPARLRPSQPDNPTGFWEPEALSELNESLLEALGSTWDDITPFDDGWMQRPELAEPTQALKRLLEVEFQQSDDLVFKDPRLCLLFPLWKEVLSELDCEVQVLLVARNAPAVVDSLSKRNGLPEWRSEMLWLQYTLAAEASTRGEDRALVRYEQVVRDWREAFAEAAERLALPLPADGTEPANAIAAFVTADLDHAPPVAGPPGKDGTPWVAEAMGRLARPNALDDPEAHLAFDRLQEAIRASGLYLGALDRGAQAEAEGLRAANAAAKAEAHRIQAERDALEAGLAESERARSDAERKLEVLRGVLERSAEMRDALEDRVDLVTRNFAAQTAGLQAELDEKLIALTAAESETAARLAAQDAQAEALRAVEARLSAVEQAASERAAAEAEREAARRVAEVELRVKQESAQREALEVRIATAETARAEAEARATQAAQHASATEAALTATRDDLHSHSEALQGLLGSRSWKLTAPLRLGKDRLKGARRRTESALVEAPVAPTAWEELLPGHPFRQKFRVPVSELAGLGIGFFTYGRANASRVRVRLFDERGALRKRSLVAEATLSGDQIRDGEASRIVFDEPIAHANHRPFSIEIESIDGQPGSSVSPAIGGRLYEGRILSPTREEGRKMRSALLVVDFLTRSAIARKAFAFVSGCPGGAYRYRCEHPAESLRHRGFSVDVLPADEMPWADLLEGYQVVVCHRVPHTKAFERFVADARSANVRVVFDTDDVVFAPEIEDQIAALDDLPSDERALWLDGVQRYRRSLELCDDVMVSTPGLQASVASRLERSPALTRNCANDQMVRDAETARRNAPRRTGASAAADAVRIAYLSGTATHERDFAECVPALARLLRTHPHVQLVLAGHIRVPDALTAFEEQIETVPLMPWQDLPSLYATVDINLAPLEPDNEFTEGKSELKYFEAGLLSVPTVASPVGGLKDGIRDGENGFLCRTEEAWHAALDALVRDPGLRREVGAAAYADSLDRYTTRGIAEKAASTWLDLLGPRAESPGPLDIAFIVRAPIANTGGGYKKVFHLVNHLATAGHDVTVYVEPIAHLESKSEAAIDAFCRKHFECGSASIRVGHDAIADCDVAVATNWPTAFVVDALANARQRLYLVQDDEAEFYEEGDPLRERAASTYALPLLLVSMGPYLSQLFGERNRLPYPHVEFALDDAFFEDRAGVQEKLSRLDSLEDPSLLFFARPNIPRRAFELGVAALTRFHAARPEVEIRFYGLEERVELPFPYVDLGILPQAEAAAAMRDATVHLSFSRTNASTVMFEAMASGAVAVELDAPGVRSFLEDLSTCVLCEDDAKDVATKLDALFGDPERLARIARAGQRSAARLTTENMCTQFEAILLENAVAARDGRA